MSEDKYVVVKGTSGLGNRLLSLTTGMLYSGITGRKLLISWSRGKYPGDPKDVFYRFFECRPAAKLEGPGVLEGMTINPATWKGNLEEHYGILKQRGINDLSIDVSRDDYTEDVVVFGNYTHMTQQIRPLLARRIPRLARLDNIRLMRRVLRGGVLISSGIRREVDTFRRKYLGARTIGVHVRHTDMKIDVGQYFPIVDKLMRWRKCDIFLSTDNRSVEELFRRRYGRVITTDKWVPEKGKKIHLNPECPDPERAEEEALIDMFLLAGCRYLVFSPKSSFGLVASLYSDSPRYRKIAVEKGLESRIVHWAKAFRDKYFGG